MLALLGEIFDTSASIRRERLMEALYDVRQPNLR
jgi:hypothetical protein